MLRQPLGRNLGPTEAGKSEMETEPMSFPLCLLQSLAAEVFLLELMEVFLREHDDLSYLLLHLGRRLVTGLAAPVLAHSLLNH